MILFTVYGENSRLKHHQNILMLIMSIEHTSDKTEFNLIFCNVATLTKKSYRNPAGIQPLVKLLCRCPPAGFLEEYGLYCRNVEYFWRISQFQQDQVNFRLSPAGQKPAGLWYSYSIWQFQVNYRMWDTVCCENRNKILLKCSAIPDVSTQQMRNVINYNVHMQ